MEIEAEGRKRQKQYPRQCSDQKAVRPAMTLRWRMKSGGVN